MSLIWTWQAFNSDITRDSARSIETTTAVGLFDEFSSVMNTNGSLNASNNGGCNNSQITSPPMIAFTIFLMLMFIACILGNGMVILATILSKHLRARVTVVFIVSLACSDMIFGGVVIPMFISNAWNDGHYCFGSNFCYVAHLVDVACNVASMINLLLIALDRFIAIKYPFRYLHVLKFKRAKIMVASVWIFSILWSICGIFNWKRKSSDDPIIGLLLERCSNPNYDFYSATYYGIYSPSLIAMTFFYLSILHVAIRQIRMIEATSVTLAVQPDHSSPSRSLNEQRESLDSLTDLAEINRNAEAKRKSRIRKRKRELKATKSVAIVYFAFLICWFPNMVINRVLDGDKDAFKRLAQTNKVLHDFVVYFFIRILPLINIMLNPIIYSFSNKQFRKAFKSVLSKLLGKYHSSNDYFAPSIRRDTRGISLAGVTSTTVTTSASDFSVASANNNIKGYSCAYDDGSECRKKESKVSFGGVSTNETTIIWKPD